MRSDERAIRDVHATWADAVDAPDLPCLLALMAADVVFLTLGQDPLGRDGIPAPFLARPSTDRLPQAARRPLVAGP